MAHIWVIEVKDKENGKWYPTPDCQTSRNRARNSKKFAESQFDDLEFGIRKYVREEKLTEQEKYELACKLWPPLEHLFDWD